MATIHSANPVHFQLTTILARTLLVALTLATAAIHASLGGLLFTMNAVAYATLAVAMVMPGAAAQFRWLVRLALIGFTAATIGGWVLFGARFPLAYLDKSIEAALIAVVAFELWHSDGGPIPVARRVRRLVIGAVRAIRTRAWT
jgi:hypothetical protein